MIPEFSCPKCGNAVETADKFCRNCGTPIELQAHPSRTPSSQNKNPESGSGNLNCPSCGYANPQSALHCLSCGAALRKPDQKQTVVTASREVNRSRASAISFFQSWKFTVVAAAVLIAVVIILTNTHKSNPHAGASLSPGEENAIQEIATLQKHVDASPNDTTSMLRLANLLEDVRFYTRAITTYQRYLALVPDNPDARVDMGTTFFALSFADSTRREEYLASARDAIEKAISIAPNHQLAWFNLGIIELHSGNADKATAAFKRCIDIDPGSDAGKKASQFLTQHPLTNPSQ